jgi:hypothetical protein
MATVNTAGIYSSTGAQMLNASGNFGSPTASAITVTGTITGNTLTSATGSTLSLQSAGTTAVTIDTSQNVGIGTSTILAPNGRTYNLQLGNNNSGSSCELLLGHQGDGFSLWTSGGSGAGALSFSQGTSEKMRINSSGYVFVGSTALPSSSVAGVSLSPSVTSVNPHFFSAGSATGSVAQINFINGNGTVGQISTSGSSTSYATSSDYRLKENVAPMTGALATVAQLKPVTYDWIVDKSKGQGFIAHELQVVLPDCVTGEKDAVDADGNPKYQSIDTSFLVATLTAAIQEQQAMIVTLQNRLAAANIA